MNHAFSSYDVDLVIGNMLNNKKWIAVGYNNKVFDGKEVYYYDGENS